jgi:hypothetical protein
MSDSVKQKRPIHCPLFYGGFSFHMQGSTNCKDLLSINSREWFLKYQDVRWICGLVVFFILEPEYNFNFLFLAPQ